MNENVLCISRNRDTILELMIGDIPEYLRSGEFFHSLDVQPNSELTIPPECFYPDPRTLTSVDLEHLLKTLRFWIVDQIPPELIDFLIENNYNLHTWDIVSHYEIDMPVLTVVRSVINAQDRIAEAFLLGSLQIVKYLHERLGENIDNKAAETAAQHGHLICLKYAHEHGAYWDSKTTIAAANHGQLECLKYALSNGCPWTFRNGTEDVFYLCACAARGGHLECLKYAHAFGCAWSVGTCATAAAAGHLQCLQYLHEQGCEWDATSTYAAANQGQLHCLQYLHEHGCPWTAVAYQRAVYYGRVGCIEYLLKHDCPGYDPTCDIDDFTYSDNLWLLEIAHKLNMPWTAETLQYAVLWGYTASVEYLLSNGCPGYDPRCSVWNEYGDFDNNLWLLRIAHKLSLPWTTETMRHAQREGFLHSVKFLVEHGCPSD